MPHVHLLLTLAKEDKLDTPEKVDRFVKVR